MPVSHAMRLLTLPLFLTACSLFGGYWPDRLPERTYFIDAYSHDTQSQEYRDLNNYLLWIRRFYLGLNIIPGWLDLTDEVMESLPAGSGQLEARLDDLGKKISIEWVRPPGIRKINSRMANTWRDALLEARERGEIIEFVALIEQDVDALKAGELADEDIYFERYYMDSFEF